MATERLSMVNIREVLRQKWLLGRSHREVAESLGRSAGTIAKTVERARLAQLDWATVQTLSDLKLEERLYGPKLELSAARAAPDPVWIHGEYQKPGVTLALLHLEYLEREPSGYRYTQFCEHYRQWLKRQGISMRQVHRGGEKMFVDFSGKKPHITNPVTGEITDVELFVAVLGASSYTYAEAVPSQKIGDWLSAHVNAFDFFGGVAAALVPDQLRSAVSRPSQFDPEIQRSYLDLARHYDTIVLPARPRKPKDKAKVEVAVQIVQRWILAALRNETFFSLAALNERIRQLLKVLNDRPMKRLGGESRKQRFERLDKPNLRTLPAERFVPCEWRTAKPNIDYHVELDRHYYSVPYTLRHERVDVRLTNNTVEVFMHGERVAAHRRSREPYRFTTQKEHMPKAHEAYADFSPSRVIAMGQQLGPNTARLFEAIMNERAHPEQGFRTCMGLVRLARRYKDRMEAASARALAMRLRSTHQIENVLKNGLDRLPLPKTSATASTQPTHENVRGPDYYDDEESNAD